MSVRRSDIYSILVVLGVLTGLQFTYMAENNKGLPLVDDASIEYGFYMFDFGSSTCRFFRPDVEPPSNLSEFRSRDTFSCAGVWEKYYLEYQISSINDSTNSSEVQKNLQASRNHLENGNTSEARKQLQKIEVRKQYYLDRSSPER